MDLPFFVALMTFPQRFQDKTSCSQKTKPRATFSPGSLTCPVTVVIIGNGNNESQDYLEEVPCPEPPHQLSLPEPGKRWTRRESNPHL